MLAQIFVFMSSNQTAQRIDFKLISNYGFQNVFNYALYQLSWWNEDCIFINGACNQFPPVCTTTVITLADIVLKFFHWKWSGLPGKPRKEAPSKGFHAFIALYILNISKSVDFIIIWSWYWKLSVFASSNLRVWRWSFWLSCNCAAKQNHWKCKFH